MVLTKMKCGKIGILLIQKILKIGLCCERREGGGGRKYRAAAPGGRAQRAPGGRVGLRADNRAERRRCVGGRGSALRWVGLSTPVFTEFAQNPHRLKGGTCWPHVSVLAQTVSFLWYSLGKKRPFSPQPYGICNLWLPCEKECVRHCIKHSVFLNTQKTWWAQRIHLMA